MPTPPPADVASPPPVDLLVVGGGITGLAAALHAARAGRSVHLLEAAPRLGGALETLETGGYRFELGPNTVLGRPQVLELAAAAGMSDELLAPSGAPDRYVYRGGRLHPLPGNPPALLRSRLFPFGAKLRLLGEPWAPGPPATEDDESVADFARRRFGRAILDWAVGPFVSGVFAGDPERLALAWAFPEIARMEREHGSLLRAAVARARGAATDGGGESRGGGRPAIVVPARGFAAFAEALGAAIEEAGGRVSTGAAVAALRREKAARGGGWVAEVAEGAVRGRQVVATVAADVLARLLGAEAGDAARPLAEVPYAPLAVVSLGCRRRDLEHPLDGFGFLAPRREELRILGCLFPSSLFPGRAPDDRVALTVFAGGRTDPEAVELPDDRLLARVIEDLGRAVGLRGEPELVHVRRWLRAIPQYERGHGRFVERVAELERDLPGLHVAGSFVGGPSVPDSIARGEEAARRAIEAIG